MFVAPHFGQITYRGFRTTESEGPIFPELENDPVMRQLDAQGINVRIGTGVCHTSDNRLYDIRFVDHGIEVSQATQSEPFSVSSVIDTAKALLERRP